MLEKDAKTFSDNGDYSIERETRLVYAEDGKTIVGTRQIVINYRKANWWQQILSGRWPSQLDSSSLSLCDLTGAPLSITTVEGTIVEEQESYKPALTKLREEAAKGAKPAWPVPGPKANPEQVVSPPLTQGPSSGGGGGGADGPGGPGAGGGGAGGGSGVTFVEVSTPTASGGGCPQVAGRITVCAKRLAPEHMR